MKKLLIFIPALLILVNLNAGGPWTQKKNQGYFKLSEWWIVFDEHYTDQGFRDPNVTTGIFNTFLYAEYGLSDRLTAIVNAPILSRTYMNNLKSRTTGDVIVPGEALNSIGDFDLGLKYSLTPVGAKIPVAASLIFGLPTGTTGGGSQENLQTGDGEFNQLFRIDAGTGFNLGSTNAYLSGYGGFNNRTNEFSDEIRFGLEFGVGLVNNKLWLALKYDVIESLKNGATAETATSTSIFANNTEFSSIMIEASYYVSRNVGISAGIATAYRGEIIAAAPSYSVGVFYDMSR